MQNNKSAINSTFISAVVAGGAGVLECVVLKYFTNDVTKY